MQALLTNPAIQAAGVPFVVALLLALLLRRFAPAGIGLAVVAGFLVSVWLITGLTLQPLTSTRKIIICSLVLPFVLSLLEMIPLEPRLKSLSRAIPAVVLSVAALWIIWPVLQRQEGMALWLMAIPVVVFPAAIMYGTSLLMRMQDDTTRVFSAQAANALVLAVGTGVVTLIAASALYSQLAFAVAAATGAIVVTLLVVRGKTARLGSLTLYAAGVPVTLLAVAATIYVQLPLLALVGLALVPLFAWLPLIKPQQRWLQLIVTCLWASVPVAPVVWWVWRTAEPLSF